MGKGRAMTDDQANRLLSLADRMQRAMPVNPLVIELHGLLREIIRSKAPAPKPAARAKPSTREVVEGAIERSKTRKGRAVKQRA
jgi:hypothetical protein